MAPFMSMCAAQSSVTIAPLQFPTGFAGARCGSVVLPNPASPVPLSRSWVRRCETPRENQALNCSTPRMNVSDGRSAGAAVKIPSLPRTSSGDVPVHPQLQAAIRRPLSERQQHSGATSGVHTVSKDAHQPHGSPSSAHSPRDIRSDTKVRSTFPTGMTSTESSRLSPRGPKVGSARLSSPSAPSKTKMPSPKKSSRDLVKDSSILASKLSSPRRMQSSKEINRREEDCTAQVRRFRSVPDVSVCTLQEKINSACSQFSKAQADPRLVEEDMNRDAGEGTYASDRWKACQELENEELISEVRRLERAVEEEKKRTSEERQWMTELQATFASELEAQRNEHTRGVKELEETVSRVVLENQRLSNQVEQLLGYIQASQVGNERFMDAAAAAACSVPNDEGANSGNASTSGLGNSPDRFAEDNALASSTKLVPITAAEAGTFNRKVGPPILKSRKDR